MISLEPSEARCAVRNPRLTKRLYVAFMALIE